MKPKDLLIFRNLDVKVGDFGSAIKMTNLDKINFEYSITAFTQQYARPDILKNKKATYFALIRADYYSLKKTF